ncbi:MAG: rane protein [Bacillota bacterium]|jgi:tripartite ATP-independent transporter DctM subunit|nr:rane protein [Bacillota bacterium]
MTLVVIAFFVLIILGMPVAFAIGIAGALFFIGQDTLSFTIPVQLTLTQTQNFAILAIPLFVFAGNLLNETGITRHLMLLASALTGHMRAGIAQVNMVLAAMMGGVTSSAIGDATMLGRILGPGMMERKYAKGFAAGVIGCSSIITTMIPPGTGLILYGSIGEVSIGKLFVAGMIPGILMTAMLMVAVTVTARRYGYPAERQKRAPLKEIGKTSIDCIWALMFPVILIVGLRFGLFTPSEAGAFAVVYAIVVGLVIYREITWEKFTKCLEDTILDVGMIMLLICLSGSFGYALTWERIPQVMMEFLLGISSSPTIIMGILVLFLLAAGMFMDSTVLILLLTSMLVPVADQMGIDPIHFGIVMVLTLTCGLLTPPVGVVMYIVCSIFNCSIVTYLKESLYLFLAMAGVILAVILFPQLTLWLPSVLF